VVTNGEQYLMISNLKTPNLNVPRSEMAKIGDRIMNLIKDDCANGLGQDGKNFPSYRSEQYKKYKNNWMKRFTTRHYPNGTTSRFGGIPAGTTTNAGTNLKSLGGGSAISNVTTHVNMTLTGNLLDGLHSIPFDNAVVIAYNEGDKWKIFGNEEYGRNIVGLHDTNIEKVGDMIFKILSKEIDDWAREDIVITVTK